MCFTLPAKIIEVDGNEATVVDVHDKRRKANISALEGLSPGDWVLMSADLAVGVISEEEAREVAKLYRRT